MQDELDQSFASLLRYPDPTSYALRNAIAGHCNALPEQVVIGNGSSELLTWLPYVAAQKHWLVPIPGYGEHRRSAALAGCRVTTMPLGSAPDFALDWDALDRQLDESMVLLLGHPNNPTGRLLDTERFEPLRRRHPRTLFVVDEVFADFSASHASVWRRSADNLLVLRSLSHRLAVPDLRLGYALTDAKLAESLRDRLPPWSVDLLAQHVGERHFTEPQITPEMLAAIAVLKAQLLDGLRRLPDCCVVESAANWVMLGLSDPRLLAWDVVDRCRGYGVNLAICEDVIGLNGQWLRIALRGRDENDRIVRTIATVLSELRRGSCADV